jgi:hypothetical protein
MLACHCQQCYPGERSSKPRLPPHKGGGKRGDRPFPFKTHPAARIRLVVAVAAVVASMKQWGEALKGKSPAEVESKKGAGGGVRVVPTLRVMEREGG